MGADGWARVDGVETPLAAATMPVTDVAFLRGWSVFETLAMPGADLDLHLGRLEASCAAAAVPCPPRALLIAEVESLARRIGGRARVRITLSGSGLRVVTAEPATPGRPHAPVRCARVPHVDDPFVPGFVKHGSRLGWEVALARAGVDDLLRVRDGRFTEGTRSGVLATRDGRLFTAPHDGTILESTTVTRLLGLAEGLGIEVVREGPPSEGPWDALYIASSTRSIAPVIELDGVGLPGWCAVGQALARADGGDPGR